MEINLENLVEAALDIVLVVAITVFFCFITGIFSAVAQLLK